VPTDIQTLHILKRDGERVLVLGETPQLDSIHGLQEAALSLSETGGRVMVDCGGVEHLGAWAIQILLALETALAGAGGALEITGASPQIRKYLTLAGVSECFPEARAGGNPCPRQC